MYVRGYLQGSENGRVVTIERLPAFSFFFTKKESISDKSNHAKLSKTLIEI
jgi:hypothetical protein